MSAPEDQELGKRRRIPGGKPGEKRLPLMRRCGRPTLLNEEVAREVCKLVSEGKPESVAAQAVGVHPNTLSGWYAKGCAEIEEGHENLYSEFAWGLNRARGQAVCARLDRIDAAAAGGQVIRKRTQKSANGSELNDEQYAPPDWRADAFVLERTRPEFFAAKNRVEHSGTVRQESVNVALIGNLTDDQCIALSRLMKAGQTGSSH